MEKIQIVKLVFDDGIKEEVKRIQRLALHGSTVSFFVLISVLSVLGFIEFVIIELLTHFGVMQ